MKLVRTYLDRETTKLAGSVVTIGNFDGCHLGHQLLLNKTMELAASAALPSVVLSFAPLPHDFFKHDKKSLMSISEKFKFLQALGIDYFYLLKFNAKLAQLTAAEFVKLILCDVLNAKHVVVGEDFCFGNKREGTAETLQQLGKEFGFAVTVLQDYCDAEGRYSSSRLREALAESKFAMVQTSFRS